MTFYCLAATLAWMHATLAWICLGAAGGASLLLVVRNLSTPLLVASENDNVDISVASGGGSSAKASPIILAILASHVIFTLVVKVVFF